MLTTSVLNDRSVDRCLGGEVSYVLSANSVTRRLTFGDSTNSIVLHPIWLRERTTEDGTVDAGSMQRLYDPAELDAALHAATISNRDDRSTITWSDGHIQTVIHAALAQELGWQEDALALPAPVGWSTEPSPFPRHRWPDESDADGVARALDDFWTHGFVVFSEAPTKPGSLQQIAGRFGPVRETNFGLLFDVFTKPNPVDLAYTPIELKAHTDNPYRHPVPSIQFLHCLVNDATGGESTLVDGLAAFDDYREIDPNGHQVLTDTMVTYRYQYGDERLEDRSPILETDRNGQFTGIRNSDRLDFVDAIDPDILDVFYKARHGLRSLLNNPERRATFLLAPGDVMMMNNRRLLHGRNSFQITTGLRHLQGCYIELDGPVMLRKQLALAAAR